MRRSCLKMGVTIPWIFVLDFIKKEKVSSALAFTCWFMTLLLSVDVRQTVLSCFCHTMTSLKWYIVTWHCEIKYPTNCFSQGIFITKQERKDDNMKYQWGKEARKEFATIVSNAEDWFLQGLQNVPEVPIAYSSPHCSIFPCWFWHDCSNVFLPCTLATKEQILKSQIRKCECLMPSSYHTGSMEHIFKIKKLFHSVFTYPLLCVQESQELDVEKFKWIFLEENQEDEQLIAKVSSVFFSQHRD